MTHARLSDAATRSSQVEYDLSVQQAARRHNVNEKTVRRWISAGILPAVRVGPRLIRVSSADLDALVRPVPSADAS